MWLRLTIGTVLYPNCVEVTVLLEYNISDLYCRMHHWASLPYNNSQIFSAGLVTRAGDFISAVCAYNVVTWYLSCCSIVITTIRNINCTHSATQLSITETTYRIFTWQIISLQLLYTSNFYYKRNVKCE